MVLSVDKYRPIMLEMTEKTPRLLFLLLVLSVIVGSCDRGSSTTAPLPTPIRSGTTSSVPTITRFSWENGYCAGTDFDCDAAAQVDGPSLVVKSETADPPLQASAQLNERGIRGLSKLARDILAINPRLHSGGCGMACDGLTFGLTIEEEGSAPWSGTWGWGISRGDSPFQAAYDRTHLLVQHAVGCQADPWLIRNSVCTPAVTS